MGRYLTQSLFLEINYSTDAVFTLKEKDFIYEGKYMFSMKQLYLSFEDPTEYEFANTILCSWKHWQKLSANTMLKKHIDEWRSELEYKLRSKGIKGLIAAGATGNFQAAKWLADRGWDTRKAGRPSKEEIERETEFQTRASNEYGADVLRIIGK